MPTSFFEPAREVEISSNTNVLVVGGGIAGVAAALAAAREGAKVTLVERQFALGGMATLGLVTIYLPLDDGKGNQVIFGIGEELLKASIAHGAEAMYPKAWLEGGSLEERIKSRYVVQFNAQMFALEMEKMLVDLGVEILYGTYVVGVHVADRLIQGVIVENKSGRSAIACKSVIDASGDADIAYLAGDSTKLYAAGNGLASWYYYLEDGEPKLKMFGLADIKNEDNGVKTKENDPYNNVKVEAIGTMRFSGVDGKELSLAVLSAHAKMYEDILNAKKSFPDYVPVTMSTIPLVRMSRRIVGTYTLDTSEDHKSFDDSIGMTGDWRKAGPCFEIPFGTLRSKNFSNLLACGRDISVTDEMWDITRVIPPCALTGEAAGTAAALTSDFHSIDIQALQNKLVQNGNKLHLSDI